MAEDLSVENTMVKLAVVLRRAFPFRPLVGAVAQPGGGKYR